jgi:cardiolipin synthase A/B
MLHSSKVSEMDELLDAITALVSLVSPEKVQALATRVRQTEASKAASVLSSLVGTPVANIAIEQLVTIWQAAKVSADEVASMLVVASHVYNKVTSEQSVELVWTGPTTPFVSARRTEQALLQVINSAKSALFITSFVAYDVSTIVSALNEASARGVSVTMLLESSQGQGGSISFDVLGKMKTLTPSAKLFAWRERASQFSDGRVHAKVAVADREVCFITSANLTGHAMEQNMEAGVLLSGGRIPSLLHDHLQALIDTNTVLSA